MAWFNNVWLHQRDLESQQCQQGLAGLRYPLFILRKINLIWVKFGLKSDQDGERCAISNIRLPFLCGTGAEAAVLVWTR